MKPQLRRLLVIAPPYVWLVIFFLIPFLIVFKVSLSDSVFAVPPYVPVYVSGHGWVGIKEFLSGFDFDNYIALISDNYYASAYLTSLKIASIATLLTLLVAYPLAYGMASAPANWRGFLMMLMIMPFWTSLLIRIYAWMGILADAGFLNQFLLWVGIIHQPLIIMNTPTAVYIGIVYAYLPFMVLPIYAVLEKSDVSLIEAATDLGCSKLSAFWLITFPLSLRGIISGCFLVFIPVIGEFVIPSLLGGSKTLMIGRVLWDEFFSVKDWPAASAVAVVLLGLLLVPIALFLWFQKDERQT